MVIANLDGQVEKVFGLGVRRERDALEQHHAQVESGRATEAASAAQPAATHRETKREDDAPVRSAQHGRSVAADLDDAGLPIWLL
jgi:hypothetical protein